MNETVRLVRRAKRGDREAWRHLYARYLDRYLDRYHGDIGTTVRRLGSTHDFLASAFKEAMDGIDALRNESAFFVWVTAIIRHKIAAARKLARRERAERFAGRGRAHSDEAIPLQDLEDYDRVLQAILDLFPTHPREMAAVALRYLDGLDARSIMDRLGRPSSTVYRWLERGLLMLRERLRT